LNPYLLLPRCFLLRPAARVLQNHFRKGLDAFAAVLNMLVFGFRQVCIVAGYLGQPV
jgi:hypothetical protein